LYYDKLTLVRTHHDINQWLKFFLTGVIESAKQGIQTFDGIMRIQQAMDARLKPLGSRGVDARKVINHLFGQPVTDAVQVAGIIGKSNVSAYKLIADLVKIGILKEITGGQRDRIYIFEEYVGLFQFK